MWCSHAGSRERCDEVVGVLTPLAWLLDEGRENINTWSIEGNAATEVGEVWTSFVNVDGTDRDNGVLSVVGSEVTGRDQASILRLVSTSNSDVDTGIGNKFDGIIDDIGDTVVSERHGHNGSLEAGSSGPLTMSLDNDVETGNNIRRSSSTSSVEDLNTHYVGLLSNTEMLRSNSSGAVSSVTIVIGGCQASGDEDVLSAATESNVVLAKMFVRKRLLIRYFLFRLT
jgi:hypothetical protein